MMNTKFVIQDVRVFDPKAVQIAQYLGSNEHADYRRIEAWLKANAKYADFDAVTLVDLFDREVGMRSETTPHPSRAQQNG